MALKIIVSIIMIVVGVIFIFIGAAKNNDATGLGMLSGIWITLGVVFFILAFEEDKPTAMDVYRGRTALEITYRGAVPVDTTVVFIDSI